MRRKAKGSLIIGTLIILASTALAAYPVSARYVDESRRRAFIADIKRGDDKRALLAITTGVDINTTDSASKPKSLIRYVIDNMRGIHETVGGKSALVLAVEHRDHMTATELVRRGATDINGTTATGETVMIDANNNRWEDTTILLLNHSAAGRRGRVLRDAALNGEFAVVKWLVESGISVNAQPYTYDAEAPLPLAAAGGNPQIVSLLIARGAEVNFDPDLSTETTALMEAAANGSLQNVRLLLAHGARINEVNRLGTALYYAVCNNHLGVVKLLIARGAYVNLSGFYESPLHVAVTQSDFDIMRYLKSHGARARRPRETR